MTKYDFMKELESLLQDISVEERMEAIQYYENYFFDAGIEQEESILTELGSPAKVAKSIKALLNSNEQDIQTQGYFTEKGYEDENLKDPKYEIINGKRNNWDQKKETNQNNEENNTDNGHFNGGDYRSFNNDRSYQRQEYSSNGNSQGNNYQNSNSNGGYSSYQNKENNNHTNNGLKTTLLIILCIFAIPVGIPLIVTVLTLFVVLIIAVASIWLVFAIVSVAFLFSGVVVAGFGVIRLITMPAVGLCIVGGGVAMFGIGMLFILATIGLSKKVLPALFRGFVELCRLPFRNRRVPA